MVVQSDIDKHAARIDTLTSEFSRQVSSEIDKVVEDVAAHVMRTLDIKGGVIEQTRMNAVEIRLIENAFIASLNASGFHGIVQAFISQFPDQLDEFESLYNEMRDGTDLPPIQFVEDDRAIISAQAGAALAAIESQTLRARADLRQLVSRFMGGIEVSELISGVSDIIRRLTLVVPIARDQLMVFFRLIGSLVYSNVENSGVLLRYAYMGDSDDRNRKFCAGLVGKGSFSRSEIDQMNNGQVAGVFENSGGYGCRHWWVIVQ